MVGDAPFRGVGRDVRGVGVRPAQAEPYPVRWFFLQTNFKVAQQAERAIKRVEQAAALGLNGVVVVDSKFFTLGLYGLDAPGHPYQQNIQRFVEACKKHGIEIIPYLPGASRAESILAHDPHLAAGTRCATRFIRFEIGSPRSSPIVRWPSLMVTSRRSTEAISKAGRCRIGPDWRRFLIAGCSTPAAIASARTGAGGPKRAVPCQPNGESHPYRRYRVSVWVKTEKLTPEKTFKLEVYGKRATGDNRALCYDRYEVLSTQGWTQVEPCSTR